MLVPNYLDFDLQIERVGDVYRAQVLNSPAGNATHTFSMPFSPLESENYLLRLSSARQGARGSSLAIETAKAFGGRLFETVFDGEVQGCLRASLDIAGQEGKGLRIRLRLTEAPDLLDLPWEYLYNQTRNQFYALSVETPLVRYLEMPGRIAPLALTLPLRVLVMIASPKGYPPLDIEREWKKLRTAVRDLEERGLVVLERLEQATLPALRRRLRTTEYHLFHFVGHGDFDPQAQDGALIMEDEDGLGIRVSGQNLSLLMRDYRHTLRLVILDASEGGRTSGSDPFAGTAQRLVQQGIPAVIAMQFEVTDETAIAFAQEFYAALTDGYPVDAALTEARKAISAEAHGVEWGTPVLYMRAPDGHLFDIVAVTAADLARLEEQRRRAVMSEQITQIREIDRIEQYASILGGCNDVVTISRAHSSLVSSDLSDSDLADPVSALLRSFRRISEDVEAASNQESTYNQRLALSVVEERLDILSRELDFRGKYVTTQELSHPRSTNLLYAERFQPIADSWRMIVAHWRDHLAETAEQRREIDSPYVIGVPLTEQQEIFVGRAGVSARIEQLLLDRRRPPLLLYGQRRMGKTSLLNNLGRLLPSTIVPLFVDLQGPTSQASDHAGLIYNLVRGMIESTRRLQRHRDLELLPLTRESLSADPFTRFDEWLDEVERALGSNIALLILDEFEALDSAISRGRFEEEDVLGMLRHIIQHRPRFKVLLAGSHTLDELQRWASYLINVQVVRIGYLKEAEARQLVERPVKDFALRYEPDASQRVLDLTRGHPFLVQLLCAEIVAHKNEQEPSTRRLARLADVEAAVPESLSSGSLFFADIQRNQIDRDGLALLRFLAGRGEGTIVDRETLALQFTDDLRTTLDLLARRELIEAVDGGYRFQVELIRRWFADHAE